MAAVVALLFIAVVISRFEGGGDVTSLYRSEEKAPAAPADSGLGGTVRRLPVAGRLESRAGHVVASGRVLRGDGSPAAGVFVALAKPSTGIFGALGGALGAGLGVGCVPDAISCGAGRSVGKTAADGSYALRLDAVADAYVIQARTAHSDDNGAFLEVRLPEPRPDVAGGTVPIPVLRFWEPGIRPLLEGLKMRVDFDALAPDGYGELEFITLNVSPREQNAKTRPLYYESVVRPGVDFDVRAIEDVPSEISLNADTEASVEGIEIDLSVVSASVPIDAPARAPPSRKASCVMTPPHRACSLTDGDFEDEYYDGNRRQPVAIDLGRVFAARLVVFHGCFIDCTLETSPDGKSWRSKTFDTPHDQVIFWEEPGRVRFVRVAGEDTRHGREVSVWE